jgi:hypothetical protein
MMAQSSLPRRRAQRGIRPVTRPGSYWSKERMLNGLRLFYKAHGFAPTSTEAYHAIVKGSGFTHGRIFPSFYAVLRYFSSFRAAWTAVGVDVNRSEEPWTADEEWYLREGTGILSRVQIAIDLKRTPDAVHRRLYDLGLNARNRWGWTVHRVGAALKIPAHKLTTHIDRGDLPFFRGSWCIYVDPADLVGLPGIDWRRASKEIKAAARQSLMERLTKILAGVDWRAGRLYQAQALTHKRYKDRLILQDPKPNRIRQGDTVQVIADHRSKRVQIGRGGLVKMVHFSTNPREGYGGWRARVEFKKQKRHGSDEPRIIYSIPLAALKKVRQQRKGSSNRPKPSWSRPELQGSKKGGIAS